MIRILKEAETNRGEIFAREDPVDSVEEPVRAILAQVKARGDEALKEYTKAFDGVELTSLEVGPGAVDEGFRSADPLLVEILYRAAERIAAFHQHQVRNSFLVNEEDGILMGQKVLPLARVGLYVPGGHRRLSLQRADELHPRQAGRGKGDLHGDPAGEKWEDSPQHPGGGPDLRGGPGVSGGGRPSGGRSGLRHGEHPQGR